MSTYFKATHRALGPQSEHVAALIARAGKLTVGETEKLAAARVASQDATCADDWEAAWDTARYAARDAVRSSVRFTPWEAASPRSTARYAARCAAWDAARFAVLALVVRDLISTEHYDLLTGPWAQVIGPAHPDDKESKQ